MRLNVTHFKILDTIFDLNKNGFYPSNEGIFKILSGKKDDETLQFKDYKTYSTLISCSSKRICSMTLVLFRHKYLIKKYDKVTNELYFQISKLGIEELEKFHAHSKNNYVKKEIVDRPTIVRIDD